MPTDIAPAVTATYDAVISVANDTEVLTAVALRDMVRPIANRVEFVRSKVPDASATPERTYTLREDFLSIDFNISSGFIRSDATVWQSTKVGNPVITGFSASAKNPGVLGVLMPGDAASNTFKFYLADNNGKTHNATNIRHCSIVAQVAIVPNVVGQAAWGFAQDGDVMNGGTNSMSLFYIKTSANWQILYRKASAQTIVDTGVPVVVGEFVVCRFILDTVTGDIPVEINGSVVTTITAANKPIGDMTFGGRFEESGNAVGGFYYTDFLFVSADSGARNGP